MRGGKWSMCWFKCVTEGGGKKPDEPDTHR
jgi:hypothetical protein